MSALPQDPQGGKREFYREKLALAFRYSREFSEPLGSVAEQIVDSPGFESVLREAAPGSLDCARRIGEMAVVRLDRIPSPPGPWWRDLLNYERSYFLQDATTVEGPPTNRPRRGVSALCTNFSWAMPELLNRLKSGRAVDDELQRPSTLLFSRQANGEVCVVEIGAAVEKVFRSTNGLRTVERIAAAAGVQLDDTRRILQSLAEIGAVVLAMTPEEMTRLIEAREKR